MSTVEPDTADLVSLDQLRDQEAQIDSLIRQLGQANRDLIDAVEMDERKHTVTRAGQQVTQEMVVSDFVRGPKGEHRLENACIL